VILVVTGFMTYLEKGTFCALEKALMTEENMKESNLCTMY